MNKETYIPQELFEHYEVYMFDINRTKDVYNLILKMWNENKELQQKVNRLESEVSKERNRRRIATYDNAQLDKQLDLYKNAFNEIREKVGGSNE